jgi:hypothetical protein
MQNTEGMNAGSINKKKAVQRIDIQCVALPKYWYTIQGSNLRPTD